MKQLGGSKHGYDKGRRCQKQNGRDDILTQLIFPFDDSDAQADQVENG